MDIIKVEIIFKHTLADKVKNLFRPKAKRFPAVVTFTGFDAASHSTQGVRVRWGKTAYHYPWHQVKRLKLTYKDTRAVE